MVRRDVGGLFLGSLVISDVGFFFSLLGLKVGVRNIVLNDFDTPFFSKLRLQL